MRTKANRFLFSFLAAAVALAANAHGETYTYSGNQITMNQGQAPVDEFDTVEWDITGGYFGTSGARSQTYSNANLIFTNVVQNNGWGEAVTRFSSATTVTGAGPFSLSTAGLGQDYVFAGNMQGYSGDVNIAAFGNTTLALGNTGSSVVQYGGETAGGDIALGSITSDSSGDWINNVAGSGSITANNLVFNYGTDASYDYVTVTNTITQRQSINFTGDADVLATGKISGAGVLNKSGTGSLTLSANNDYTGNTNINAGTLQVGVGGTAGTLGTGSTSISSGAELVFNRSNNFTVSNTISGDGLVTKKGGGRMTVNGNNSGGTVNWNFTGTGNGDIGFSNANAIGGTGSTMTLADDATGSAFFGSNGNTSDVAITLGSGSTLTWNGSIGNTNTLSGQISGDGNFTKISGETLVFTGNNSYSGTTTITTGTLRIGNGGTTGTLGSGTVTNNAALAFNRSDNLTTANDISGSGSLTQQGTGVLTLTGNNTYTGNTIVAAGVLALGSSGSISQSAVISVASGGEFDVSSVVGGWTLAGGQTLAGNGTVSGNVEAAGTLSPGNSIGTISITGDVSFAATSTYAADINTGTGLADRLVVGGDLAIASGSVLALADLGGSSLLAIGTRLALIDYSNGLWDGGLFTYNDSLLANHSMFSAFSNDWMIRYDDDSDGTNDGNFVTLTVIPEPGAPALFLLGALALLRRRR